MEPQKKVPPNSRLFSHNILDVKDEQEERYEKLAVSLQGLVGGKGEKELNDTLSVAVAKDAKSHDDICVGFMVLILTEAETAQKHYRHLTLVARDGLNCVITELTRIVLEKYLKCKEEVRRQLLWFIREMIKNQVQNIDGLCWSLMRQIAGGDLSQKNLWLADTLMDIFSENRAWLEKFQFLLLSVVYTYLRIIEDHAHANLAALRAKEVNFVVTLIRDRFIDVINIGRDLVRLLQNIARVPEIEQLWNDILYNPTTLAPTFTGITQIMNTRTSRRFLQSRITPEMEKKMVYLTSQVRFGSHKRYQDWFQKSYLATMESQTLRCDLIRFIVGVIHPTNELLCSDIIPRWAVIGWLLTTCTNPVAASNAKLALFYDWLFYDQDKDNIMNIEPAILVMHHSMRPHPAITATLLDFLCRIIHNFFPAGQDQVRNGIYSSLRQIVDKKVLPSLSPLFDNQRLDRELRSMLRERFGAFLAKEDNDPGIIMDKDDIISHEDGGPKFSDSEEDDELPSLQYQPEEIPIQPPIVIPKPLAVPSISAPKPAPPLLPSAAMMTSKPANPTAVVAPKMAPNPVLSSKSSDLASNGNNGHSLGGGLGGVDRLGPLERRMNHMNGETDEDLQQEILDKIVELGEEQNSEKRCELMDQLVQIIIQEQADNEENRLIAEKLSEVLRDQFEGRIFPDPPTKENIAESVEQPLFVIFRALCEISEIDPSRQPLFAVLAELYGLQPRLGYYLLYFLKSYNKLDSKSKANLYKDLGEAVDDNNSLDIFLVNDMRQCQEDDVNLFVYLLPDIYTHFQKTAIGNVDLLYLVVSCVDGRQIQALVSHIIARDFLMFKKDSFQPVINVSLSWETFEQYALWQLLLGHDIPVDCILPLIPRLSYDKHAEVLTHFMHLLRREKPTAELIKHLMSREPHPGDRFVTTVLSSWLSQQFEDGKKLGDLIGSQLCKQASPAGGKRKRTTNTNKINNSLGTLAEMTLGHLDLLRQNCRNYDLFNLRSIQQALQTVRSLCTDTQKKKFSDLFALADSESDDDSNPKHKKSKPGRSPTKGLKKSGGAAASGGGGSVKNSETSGLSTETDEDAPPPPPMPTKGKGRSAKTARKRANKVSVSYKEMGSTDDSSDDEEIKKTPKKRKKVTSESE